MTDFDFKKFFDAVRGDINLTTQNVAGTEKIITYGLGRGLPLGQFAYVLATAWWESAQTMWPVEEAFWLSDDWRRRNLRYYPWHGRGLIQTTWEDNYRTMARETGLPLTTEPGLLLLWEGALPALFVGMEKGLYTGHALDDHIDDIDESDDEDLREMIGARRIVNGTDKKVAIAKLGLVFERGLKAGGYGARPQ